MQVAFEQLRRKEDFLRTAPEWVQSIWPRLAALNWFIRSNKAALVSAGAIHRVGREWLIVADRFPEAAQVILAGGAGHA